MVSMNKYIEKRKENLNKAIETIDKADYAAIERDRKRKYGEEENSSINYSLCEKYDRKEAKKFHDAADTLMKHVMENPENFFGIM